MHLAVLNSRKEDIFYPSIPQIIKAFIPEFESVFDGVDEIYMILGEFGRFIQDNVDNCVLFEKCIDFINYALINGGDDTEKAFGLQVFNFLYTDTYTINKINTQLNSEALIICNKYIQMSKNSLF